MSDYTESLPTRIADLEVGDSYVLCKRVELNNLDTELMEVWDKRLTSQGSNLVARVKAKHEKRNFMCERTRSFNPGASAVFLMNIITRTA